MAEEDARESARESAHRTDPAAWAALSGASRERADAFIEEQTILTRLQAKELAHELQLRHWSMRFSNLSSIMKVSFEIAMAGIVIFIAVLIGGAVWNAAHDDGLVIEAFSVPPELTQRGMTGEVVAGRMLDKLAAMQTQTESMRPASSYTNNWGDDIKVQIPDTGVSVGEFNRYLHQWLGHQTHISGDVVRNGNTFTVTARAGRDAGESFTGPEGDFDSLIQRAAEAVYARTQAYRYGAWLLEHSKIDQAMAVFTRDAASDNPQERTWAYVGLGNSLSARNEVPEAYRDAQQAVADDPHSVLGWFRESAMAQGLEMREAELTAVRASQRVFNEDGARELNETARTQAALAIEFNIDDALGDYTDEANHVQHVLSSSGLTVISENALYNYATELALMHDASGARRTLARARLTSASTGGRKGPIIAAAEAQNVRVTEMLCALAGGHWPQLLATARDTDRAEPALDAAAVSNAYPPTQIWPYIALGEAMTGNFTAARATIARTPGNCDACLRVRARMDAAQGNMGGAAWWFARAVTLAPSIPFAYTDWGAMLLGEGKYDDAIEKFRQANLKGPHYADPLEMWGEALMLQNRSDLALAKFEDANRYAPNWGRLHLEWGKALFYAGRKGEAKAQFAIATHLDLSTSDRASVAQWIARST